MDILARYHISYIGKGKNEMTVSWYLVHM